MDTPTELMDAPPPAYELSQNEFDNKLADAVAHSLALTARPQQQQQQQQQQPQPQPQSQQQQQQYSPEKSPPPPSVQVTPPPSASLSTTSSHSYGQDHKHPGDTSREPGYEEWDEEVFRSNELRLRARSSGSGSGSGSALEGPPGGGEGLVMSGNGKDRVPTPTPPMAPMAPSSNSSPQQPVETKQEKERPSWYADAGLSPSQSSTSLSPSASPSTSSPQGASPTTPTDPSRTPRRSPSGARAPMGGRSRSIRVLPSIPQGAVSGPTSPVEAGQGATLPVVREALAVGENGKGKAGMPLVDTAAEVGEEPGPVDAGNGRAEGKEKAREERQEKERPSWYYEAGFDKLDKQLAAGAGAGGSSASNSNSTAQHQHQQQQPPVPSEGEEVPPPPLHNDTAPPAHQEKERPSWYFEAGLDKLPASGGSGSGPAPTPSASDAPPSAPSVSEPVAAPEHTQEKEKETKYEKERPSWYYEAGLGDASKAAEAAAAASSSLPSSATTAPAAARQRSDTTTTTASAASSLASPPGSGQGALPQWPSSASTSPARTLAALGEDDEYDHDADEAPPAFTPVAPPLPGPGIDLPSGPLGRTAGRGMSPPPPIGAYVSGSGSNGPLRQQTMPPPASAPSHQQSFAPDVRAPNRYSMPAMSHASAMQTHAGVGGPGGAGAGFPARVGIQSTGQKQVFAPAGYSRRLQFNPSVAYGAEGQAGTVGAVGGGVGQESLYGNVHALYNSSVAAFLPKPVQPQYQTAAQAYAAQYANSTTSSTEQNARLSPVSMRRSPSASPSSSSNQTPSQQSNPTSPTPTYSSNPGSSPLPTPPAGGLASAISSSAARPYDTALAESVGPVAESVKQMHQQAQVQANLNRYSMAPSLSGSLSGSVPTPPVPAYPPQLQYNPLNAYNNLPLPQQPYPPQPHSQQQQHQGFPGLGLTQSQSLYSIPAGPPRGYGQPALAPGPSQGQMYPQQGYPPMQQQQQQQWGPPPPQGQQPVQGWQQGQGAYRR
ncbi:hypothetical protein CALCODRAFT_479310 [Calocera cornea HHB12733]|uniref:Uncharacterized protein n=1 Tax=Calocera cornea HHB12733 TaxID=1353952 RepID=A0A165JPN3_9BASI|nr:hypothetical protein CALCODRAFT_479310 [Calocera cornea HHB12733]